MSGSIDYGKLMHRAMRSLIQEVLRDVQRDGLPGAHHFFITFDTTHPDARLADWLRERYPEEMTVVMQNWFDALEVTDEGFSVTLNFGDAPENLSVPYDAIRTFVDPSVEFGLRFESQDEDDADLAELPPALHEVTESEVPDAEEEEAPQKDADIVSLDSFRK
ncbi:SspB family protein [Roseovarius sp. 2305UL8-3]|uniref:SspB family protein n=1 Tax=Roseovarius conchicola TaxID=3121636 RepID=UPI00352893A4